MTTHTHLYPTIFDAHQAVGVSSQFGPPIEMLARTEELFDYLPWMQANDTHVNKTIQRTGLPTVYYTVNNRGTVPSAGTFASVLDPMVTLESIHQVDPHVFLGYENPDEQRWAMESGHPVALANKHGDSWWYGVPSSDSGEILGMAQRYSDPTSPAGDNIISGGGNSDGDQMSVYVLALGPQTIFGVYPKGDQGKGLKITRVGAQMVPRVTASGSTDGQMLAETVVYNLSHGICVADWKAGVRICNIDVPDFKAAANGQALTASTHIFKCLTRAINRVSRFPNTQMVICGNKTFTSYLEVHAMDKTVNVLSVQDGLNQFGMPRTVRKFRGYPILECDSLLNTENDIPSTVA